MFFIVVAIYALIFFIQLVWIKKGKLKRELLLYLVFTGINIYLTAGIFYDIPVVSPYNMIEKLFTPISDFVFWGR